jgi:hypothetical protein
MMNLKMIHRAVGAFILPALTVALTGDASAQDAASAAVSNKVEASSAETNAVAKAVPEAVILPEGPAIAVTGRVRVASAETDKPAAVVVEKSGKAYRVLLQGQGTNLVSLNGRQTALEGILTTTDGLPAVMVTHCRAEGAPVDALPKTP